ncbi:hypothetical protein Pfo_022992 [Paulownia fortunei]|nr:hypothetical protein Pfo_022992 [Paulownia fortunei]
MAASIPRQHHSDYTFSPEFFSFPIPVACTDTSIEETSDMFNNNASINVVPFLSSDINSPVSVASFPEQFGVPDCMAVPALWEREMVFGDFAGCNYKNQVFEPGEECSGLVAPNFWPAYHMAADNWGIQGKQVAKVEETEVKVGRYSVEERKDRILRYLKKRNQRNFNKTIKYACRKTLADKRVRVRGRFAKNNEPCQDENLIKTSDHSFEQNISFYDDDSLQTMICNDDDWLQAAMAGLMYLPYIPG